ncbi:MAG: hypothetical protein MUE95_04425, partial [Cyclobacteriaceae bacterium]|nr:hypothetical protein [Cyclobacteriaceae bacterium]
EEDIEFGIRPSLIDEIFYVEVYNDSTLLYFGPTDSKGKLHGRIYNEGLKGENTYLEANHGMINLTKTFQAQSLGGTKCPTGDLGVFVNGFCNVCGRASKEKLQEVAPERVTKNSSTCKIRSTHSMLKYPYSCPECDYRPAAK